MDGTGTRETAQAQGDPEILPVEEVRELFLTLGKAVRAVQLYDPGNPVYQRFIAELRDAFSRLWQSLPRLEILVEEHRFLCEWEEVYRNEEPSESLAFLLYRDGVRAFTVTPGFEEEELEPLLEALHRARHVQRTDDDLITLLWGLDLQHFDYSYVDYLAEAVELPQGGGDGGADLRAVFEEEMGVSADGEGEPSAETPEGVVNRDDFNPTLYSLESGELATLREELQRELERDLRRDVLSALFDRLEEPHRPERQVEILDILGTVLPNLLARGELAPAARVLEELQGMMARDGALSSEARQRAGRLLDEVSSPEAVDQLVHGLEAGAVGPNAEALGTFLRHLQPRALEPLARASARLEEGSRAATLRDALQVLGKEHPSVVVDLLGSHDPAVVTGAVRLVGTVRIESGAGYMADLVAHEDAEVRQAVVDAAAAMGSSVVLEAVVDLLTDPVREVRLGAARTLGRARYRPAAEEFRHILQSRGLRRADVTEQTAFFESYGRLGDPEAVGVLDRFLNGRGRLLRKEAPEVRACAALALGKVRTADARASLQKAEDQDEPVVRNAVRRALREEGD